MKMNFWKTVLAVICGYVILQLLGLVLFFMFLGSALAVGGGKSAALPRQGVLYMNLADFKLGEQSQEQGMPDFASMSMESVPTVGLLDAIDALKAAEADPRVQYLVLKPEGATAGMSDLEELRKALLSFRASGKAVVACLEAPGNGSYYLATAADKIYLNSYHGSSYQLIGLSSQLMFLKDILDKLGVNVQLIRHGKYKSAGEMFVRSSSSPENRQQNQVLINSAWKALSAPMAEARGLSEDAFNALIDNLALNMPEDFLNAGLVDELVDHESLVQKLCTLAQVQDADELKLIPFADYVSAKVIRFPARSNVAVIYADGEIVEGDGVENIAGDRFVKEIDKVRKDSSVKAVVLRVNSPGGSVSASSKIRTALDLLEKDKPVVASFGNYAASGGYWISNGCCKIYADATTITGSIGVFSMIPEFSKVSKKLGVGIETVGSNKHSDMYSLMRPFDKAELDYMQASVEDIYDMFVNLVAEGRGISPAQVDAIAQGRVWLGSDAIGIGLVDEIGTLTDAIAYAAGLVGLNTPDEYGVVGYPAPLSPLEEMLAAFGQKPEEPSILSGTPFAGMGKAVSALQSGDPARIYARLPYAYEIK